MENLEVRGIFSCSFIRVPSQFHFIPPTSVFFSVPALNPGQLPLWQQNGNQQVPLGYLLSCSLLFATGRHFAFQLCSCKSLEGSSYTSLQSPAHSSLNFTIPKGHETILEPITMAGEMKWMEWLKQVGDHFQIQGWDWTFKNHMSLQMEKIKMKTNRQRRED